MKTLVIGAAIVDIIMKIDRLPKSGEDILCSETMTTVGGCACNVAHTLSNFGVDYDLFVPVGHGMYGDLVSGELKKMGCDILIEDDEMDNGYCLSLVEADGERTFITVKGLEGCFKPSWFDRLPADDYDNIYVAGYQVCQNSGAVISEWLKTRKGKAVYFAPGPVIKDIDREVMERIFSVSPILHLNEKEAFDYTGQDTIEECIRALYKLNHNLVVVTLGSKGTMFYDGGEIRRTEACRAEVADTIGAGDSHVAAMIAGRSRGADTERCVKLANAVAAGIVGIQGSVMSREIFEQKGYKL